MAGEFNELRFVLEGLRATIQSQHGLSRKGADALIAKALHDGEVYPLLLKKINLLLCLGFETVSSREVMERLECTRQFVSLLCVTGKLTGAVKHKGQWRIPVRSLNRYIEETKKQAL